MRLPILARYTVLFCNLLPMATVAQRVVHGLVLDASVERPLPGANVRLDGGEGGTVTDAKGHFELECGAAQEVTLRLSYVGYADRVRLVTSNEITSGERIVVLLQRSITELPVMDVHAPAPEVVFQRKDLHVGAYHVNGDGLWVLVYDSPQLWHREESAGEQVLRGARLYLLDTLFNERFHLSVPSEVRGLRKDHRQRTIVEGMKEAWFAWPGGEDIEFGRVDLTTLHEAVLPWTDSVPGYLLGNNLQPTYPAFDHFAHDPVRDTSRVICSVVDEHTMELFRSQYKYMTGHDKVVAMDLGREMGVDAEVIAGYMTGFPKDLYFNVPYAPLFVVHDTLCVFDHYRERIRRFNKELIVIDEVPIWHQRDRNWDELLLQDAANDAVHVVFTRNARTWIRRIDLATGTLGPATALTYPYPEEVQVHDGYAYYVYRPYGSLQKRTLYREVLR